MEAGFKACPYCAEPIREAAKLCRYCNREIAASDRSGEPRSLAPTASAPVPKRVLSGIIALVALGGLVVLVMLKVQSGTNGNSAPVDWLIVFIACMGPLILLSLYRRRHAIGRRMGIVIKGEIAYVGAALLLLKLGQPPLVALLAGIVCALIVAVRVPKRSRYIPKAERRKAIAKFEVRGRRFNPRIHEIDHVVPFSRGGSNTADNLRVVERERNRSKSAKSPWWDLLGRR